MKPKLCYTTVISPSKLSLLTIAVISVTAIVASQRRILVAVDVGDRRADGNGYEDEEPREAAYRPRPRHPRNDGGHTPRTKRSITIGQLVVIFGSRKKRPDCPVDRSSRSLEGHHVTISTTGLPARFSLRRRSHCFLIRPIVAQS